MTETKGFRRRVRGFMSYAHRDRAPVERFRMKLDDCLTVDRRLDFSVWWDSDILLGERWDDRILSSMATADLPS